MRNAVLTPTKMSARLTLPAPRSEIASAPCALARLPEPIDMSTERLPESHESAERPQSLNLPVEAAAIVDLPAQQNYLAMNDTRTRGAATGLAEIDGGNTPQVVESTRRVKTEEPTDPLRDEEGAPIRTIPATVQKGQTLWSISAEQQTDNGTKPTPQDIDAGIGDILYVNPELDPDAPLKEGQQIEIPEKIRTGFRTAGRHFDGAPTAMVLDSFDGTGSDHGVVDTSHGGFLGTAFNSMGFNIVRANLPEIDPMKHTHQGDFTETMTRAANYIEANREQFPPNSFLNTSFGNAVKLDENGEPVKGTGDLTWEELSKMVGLHVNPDNIKESTNEILKRLGDISEGRDPVTGQPDSKISAHDREIAGAAVRTNQQIERIQSLGVEVIHSAGNDGADRVDINFLRATVLRADAPHGTEPLSFSAIGDHTVHGAGVVPVFQVDSKTVVAEVNGVLVRMPIDPDVVYDPRDHRIDYEAIQRGDQRQAFQLADKRHPERFDIEAFRRGYEQRDENVGNMVDSFTGTSFSPISYIARTRHIPRPFKP